MTLVERLELQARVLEQENYHTAAETMREAAKTLIEIDTTLKGAKLSVEEADNHLSELRLRLKG
jgi:hypothetical protein